MMEVRLIFEEWATPYRPSVLLHTYSDTTQISPFEAASIALGYVWRNSLPAKRIVVYDGPTDRDVYRYNVVDGRLDI